MLDRYGDAIEADFHRFYGGLDVVDVLRVDQVATSSGVRGKRRMSMRKFRALVERLPRHSATAAARADDDEQISELMEYAEQFPDLKAQIQENRKRKPTLEGYTPEAQRLDQLTVSVDRVFQLLDAVLAGGKSRLPPLVLPETAHDRWERRASERRMDDLFAEVAQAQQRWREKHAK